MSDDRYSFITVSILIVAGVTLLFIGLIVSFLGSLPLQKIEGGGIILIGPIPIIITGEGAELISIIVLLLLIVVLIIVIMFVIARRTVGRLEHVE